jgi:hypothetical protein
MYSEGGCPRPDKLPGLDNLGGRPVTEYSLDVLLMRNLGINVHRIGWTHAFHTGELTNSNLVGLQHRQVGSFIAVENAPGVNAGLTRD